MVRTSSALSETNKGEEHEMAGAPGEGPVARLGTAPLDEPLESLSADTVSSFRAVPERAALATELGPLNDLPGRWSGSGFNLTARPHFGQGSDRFVELNLTRETLEFTTIGSPIPNRGSDQADINLRGVTYLQQISDAKTNGALHIEPGIWLHIPPTTAPAEPESVSRLACVPHGDAACAVGTASNVSGKPKIEPVNTVPFAEGEKAPAPGTPNSFPEYDLSKPSQFRTSPNLLGGISQDMVNDPTVALRHALHAQSIAETQTLSVTSHKDKGGGVHNIPFITQNANASFMNAIFWIERVEGPNGNFLQLQYVQTVLLDFKGLHWPHVSVATLLKTF
jgi:hypothetical protein